MSRAMKDSGIEWIGEIPEDWKVVRLKNVTTYNDESLSENTNPDFEFDYIDISSVEYGKGIIQFQRMIFKNSPSRARRIIKKDDVILSTVRTYLKAVAKIYQRNIQQIASTGFIVLRAKPNYILPNFLYYGILSNAFISMVEAKSVGISYPAINASDVVDISLPIPKYSQQKQISDFLETQCKKIDGVIEKTRETIGEYKKLKQSVITQAVTKGIRPNRPLKPSGIDWIGDIPENWRIKKIKYCASFIQEKYNNTDLEYIGLENIVSWNGKHIKTDSSYDKTQSLIFEKDDILWGKLRPYLAKVYHAEKNGCCSSEFCVIRAKDELNIRYFWNLLINSEFVFLVDRSTYGTKMPRANADFIKNIVIPIPSRDEQQEIADYLDEKTAEIDALIARKEQFISEMEAYKKSLIYEYVTGKKGLSLHGTVPND